MKAINKVSLAIESAHQKMEKLGMPLEYEILAAEAMLALRNPTDDMLAVVGELPQHHNRLDMWCAMMDVALGRIDFEEEETGEV